MLETTTPAGLHDYVIDQVVQRFLRPGERAVELGAGSGALAVRLRALGWNVLAAGTVRMMDSGGEPTHISPIFQDLFFFKLAFPVALGEEMRPGRLHKGPIRV